MIKLIKWIVILASVAMIGFFFLLSKTMKKGAENLTAKGLPVPQMSADCKTWYNYSESSVDLLKFLIVSMIKDPPRVYFRYGYKMDMLMAEDFDKNMLLLSQAVVLPSEQSFVMLNRSAISIYKGSPLPPNQKASKKRSSLMDQFLLAQKQFKDPVVDLWNRDGKNILMISHPAGKVVCTDGFCRTNRNLMIESDQLVASVRSFKPIVEAACQKVLLHAAEGRTFQEQSIHQCNGIYFSPMVDVKPVLNLCKNIVWPI